MSATTLVCTTLTGSQQSMPGGERLHERQAQIRAVVQRRLGDQHAHLLAEAQVRPGEDRVTWLSPVHGLVRPLAALPEAIRNSVRAECDALLADIERAGEALENGGAGDGRLAGKLLRLAARRPSDDHLFLVGNQPVLVWWGCARADAGVVLPTPTKTSAAVTPPPSVSEAARWLTPAEQMMGPPPSPPAVTSGMTPPDATPMIKPVWQIASPAPAARCAGN